MNLVKKHTFKHFDTNDPSSIIFHIDLGTEKGTLDWILNGTKSVSYNYYISRKGTIYELVPFSKGAWHSGVVHRPTDKAKAFYGNTNPNKKSIGICYEGRTVKTKANDKQIKACAELISQVLPKVDHYFTHQEVTSYKPEIVSDFKERVLEYNQPIDICSILKDAEDRIKELKKIYCK